MNAVLSVEMANSKPTINHTEVILVKGPRKAIGSKPNGHDGYASHRHEGIREPGRTSVTSERFHGPFQPYLAGTRAWWSWRGSRRVASWWPRATGRVGGS